MNPKPIVKFVGVLTGEVNIFLLFPKPKNRQIPIHSINCIRLIQAHLDYRNQIENFVNGQSIEEPSLQIGCQTDCLLGKMLHSESGKRFTDVALLDSLCNSCEKFQDTAAQVVLLKEMKELDVKEVVLPSLNRFSDASEEFQRNLVTFHLTYTNTP